MNVGAEMKRGLEALNIGRPDLAIPIFRGILRQNAQNVDALRLLGVALARVGNQPDGLKHLKRAALLAPASADVQANLGGVHAASGDLDKATACYQLAVKRGPKRADLRVLLAGVLTRAGATDEADREYRHALELEPSREDALLGLLELLERQGRYDDARAVLRELRDQGANSAKVAWCLGTLALHSGADEAACTEASDELERAMRGATTDEQRKMLFLRGQLLDRIGSYDDAFNAFARANALANVHYDDETDEREVDAMIAHYSADCVATMPRVTEPTRANMIFICGMPRSATTLVEQVLAAHSRAVALGEIDTLGRLVRDHRYKPAPARSAKARRRKGARKPAAKPRWTTDADAIAALDEAALARMAQVYLDALGDLADDAVTVDKTIANHRYLGLIAQLFPNARFVHIDRDPRDTCLSCFFHDFSGSHPFSFDLGALGRHHRRYDQLVDHWKRVFPDRVYTVRYERLVEDQEAETRNLLEFCGLEFEPSCVQFHEHKRFVRTASYHQVRKPMFRSSLARWRNYEPHLAPLLEALGDVAPR